MKCKQVYVNLPQLLDFIFDCNIKDEVFVNQNVGINQSHCLEISNGVVVSKITKEDWEEAYFKVDFKSIVRKELESVNWINKSM